jgi:hypothetical protein
VKSSTIVSVKRYEKKTRDDVRWKFVWIVVIYVVSQILWEKQLEAIVGTPFLQEQNQLLCTIIITTIC